MIRQRKPLARTARLARTPVKKVNRKRKAKAFLRAYGGVSRVNFVAALPCLICGKTPCENAHYVTGGMGRKSDARCVVPLCPHHHRTLHFLGREYFETTFNVDLAEQARRVDAAWHALMGEQVA